MFASSSSLLLYFACIDNNNSVYHDDTYSAFVKSEDICIWRDLYIYISFVKKKISSGPEEISSYSPVIIRSAADRTRTPKPIFN